MIPEVLVPLIEGPVSMHLATRNADHLAHGLFVWGAVVSLDRHMLTIYVLKAAADPVLRDLHDNGRAAVAIARPVDYAACQIKGSFVSVRDADARDRRIVDQHRENFFNGLEGIGHDARYGKAWISWPCVAIDIRVESAYLQTPGPGAGERMR